MKDLSSNRKIINILESLKDSKQNYPPELMQARREIFAKQAASIALTTKIKSDNNGTGTGDHHPTSIGTVAKTMLVIAVVLNMGTAAYLYRDKFSKTLNNVISPHTEYITNRINSYSSPPVVIPNTEEPFEIPTSISPTSIPKESPISTTTQISTPYPINIESNDVEEVDKIISTPKPKDNNGNHYGQTPKPERTKENKPRDRETKEPDDKPPKALKNK
jgi:hypothetical protein